MALDLSEETMTEVLARYDQKGYEGSFSARPEGMVFCHACRDLTPADQVPLEALHRFEGTSDPQDENVVVALECPNCGALGTLVLPYGSHASPDEHQVLSALLDDRDHSGIKSGL
jgi:hypothetical protein